MSMDANYEKAGRVAQEALQLGVSLIRPGASMRDVLDRVEAFIREQGCEPAFPAQSCVNEVAAHYCPTEDDDHIYRESDLVKIDVGVHCDGCIGDNATSISLDGKHENLVLAVKDAVSAAESILRAGVTPDEIGRTVEKAIRARGFQPVRNLTGHGLGPYQVHTAPSIPNYPSGDTTPLSEGQVIAIEPFATDGTGLIYNSTDPSVFMLRALRPVRTPYGRQVLALVKAYNGLPFTTRWLTGRLGRRALLGLNELRRAGMLEEYPPLPEKSGGMVAQHEHTFFITKNGCRRLTT